jgi:spore germination cell wall hydrolase CwlJ-like protein
MPEEVSPELNCLAGAVYFEARNETLDGQLAVARVIVARSRSGRFPPAIAAWCTSLRSFPSSTAARCLSSTITPPPGAGAGHRRNRHDGSWQSPVEGAMFFHSARISPKWHRQRVARIDNHVFYR